MREVTVRQARADLARLLDAVEAGEEILITRRGKAVARLAGVAAATERAVVYPSHRQLRDGLSSTQTPSAEVIRAIRDERG